jgi:hypothetical protein
MMLHSEAGLDSVQTISEQTGIFVLQRVGTHINDLYDSVFSPSFFERKAGAAGMSHHMPSNRLRRIVEKRNDHTRLFSVKLLFFIGSGTKDMAPSGVDTTCEMRMKKLIC